MHVAKYVRTFFFPGGLSFEGTVDFATYLFVRASTFLPRNFCYPLSLKELAFL